MLRAVTRDLESQSSRTPSKHTVDLRGPGLLGSEQGRFHGLGVNSEQAARHTPALSPPGPRASRLEPEAFDTCTRPAGLENPPRHLGTRRRCATEHNARCRTHPALAHNSAQHRDRRRRGRFNTNEDPADASGFAEVTGGSPLALFVVSYVHVRYALWHWHMLMPIGRIGARGNGNRGAGR